jgi:hypothetical protein
MAQRVAAEYKLDKRTCWEALIVIPEAPKRAGLEYGLEMAERAGLEHGLEVAERVDANDRLDRTERAGFQDGPDTIKRAELPKWT